MKTSSLVSFGPFHSLCHLFAAVLAGPLLMAGTLQAQVNWTNPAGGSWNVPDNWDAGVPGVGALVNLTGSLGAAYTVAYTNPMVAESVYSVTLNAASAAEALTLSISAPGFIAEDRLSIGTNSTVLVETGAVLTLGTLEGRRGALTMNGGTISNLLAFTHGTGGKAGAPFNLRINDGVFVTPATTLGSSENGGTLIINGGEVDLGTYSAGRDSGSTANGFSTGLIISNGVVRLSGITLSTGNSAASMRVSGGHITNTGPFIIGNSGTATARETGFRQTGGYLESVATMESIIIGNTDNSQRASLDVRGGVLNAHGVTLVSDPSFTSVNASFSVTDSGVVYLGPGGVINNATTYAVNLGNGGILSATAAWLLAADLTLSGGVGTLEAGSATPFDITITGGLKGAGILAKSGPGKLAIQGAGTHTGELQVQEGVLALEGAGALPSSASIVVSAPARFEVGSAFTLNGGQSLAGLGTVVGNVRAVSGSGVRPAGNGSTGQLTFQDGLTLDGGATVTLDLQSANDKDLLMVGGTLALNGENTILVTTSLGSGTYRLIDYGTLVGNVASLQLVGVSGRLTNNTAAGAIDLVLESTGRDPASLVWAGDGSGNLWDIGVTDNWLNQGARDQFFPNDTVTFNNSGSATPSIQLVGDLTPLAILVDATADYTFAGSGRLVGATGLTKTNTGVLAIETVNEFTGPTHIGGGTVRVPNLANGGVPSPLGSAGVEPANLTLGGGVLEYTGPTVSIDRGVTLSGSGGALAVADASATLTWAGRLTGSGSLTKGGPGTLALPHEANDYTGGTIVTGGTLLFGNAGPGAITLNGGSFATTADQQNLTNALVVLGSNNHYRNTKNNTIVGLSGDGTLEVEFAAAADTITMGGDMSGFTGRIAARGNGGNWRFHGFGTPGSSLAAFDLGTNAAIMLTRNGNTTVRLGSLTGDVTTKLTGATSVTGALTTYEIGGNNASTTFDGIIEDSTRPAPVAVSKVGTGTLTLTSYSPYTGATTVQQGTLALAAAADIGASTRYEVNTSATLDLSARADTTLYLVNPDQTLAGGGTIKGNVSAVAGTVVAPGSPIGPLTITGNITLDGTTIMELNRGVTPNCDQIIAPQILANMSGPLVVTNLGPKLAPGDRFELFSQAVAGGFSAVELPGTDASGATYTWRNDLAIDGSIQVLTSTGGTQTTPTNLLISTVSPGLITVSWPSEYIGWSLEVQTNSSPAGLGTNWVRVTGASTTNQFQLPLDPANGSVFLRMVMP